MSPSAFNPWTHGRRLKVAAAVIAAAGAGTTVGNYYGWGTGSPDASRVTGAQTAHIWMATTGSDSCTRNASAVSYAAAVTAGNVCLSYNKADDIASDGDTIPVQPGQYSALVSLGGSDRFIDTTTTHASAITFGCVTGAANDSITFNAYWFDIAKASGVTFSGRCFLFPSFKAGEISSVGTVTNITATNVHMGTFELRTASNVTIQNSEIGPSYSCTSPSTYAGTDARECKTSSAGINESWGNTNNHTLAANDGYGEAQVSASSGFQFIGNYLHDFNGRDTNGPAGHEGCIQFNSTGDQGGLVIRANTFEGCAVLGILIDNSGSSTGDTGYSNITIENNDFGAIVYPFDDATNNPSALPRVEAVDSQRDLIVKAERVAQAITLTNILVRYNSFTHGMTLNSQSITQSYSTVRVIGNILGTSTTCESGAGLTYDRNVYQSGDTTCGDANSTTVVWSGVLPYTTYSEGSAVSSTPVANFVLAAAASALYDYVTEGTSDYTITTDIAAITRPVGSGRSPGANEK